MRRFLPSILLFLISILVILINYRPGTWLTGWDNLHPEFNFPLNIQRSIFSVWQEDQGLGLFGGMGHAADLVRQVFLWGLSIFLDIKFLRYIYTFLMLIIGPLGVYFLINHFFTVSSTSGEYSAHSRGVLIASFLGGIFYLLNLATVQVFYVPFEAFTTHYGFLAWLFYSAVSYFHSPQKKHLLFLLLINILSLTQGYVPTIFVVYLTSLIIFFIPEVLRNRLSAPKKVLKIILLILTVNAFWLLPFLYFTFTSAGVVGRAHENFMATEDIFLRNKEFGKIADVSLLKGFWFKFVDMDIHRDFNYMALPWKDHLSSLYIMVIGYLLFAVVLLGIYQQIRKRAVFSAGFILLFIFSFTMLANDTFPFNFIFTFLQDRLPLFEQVFRVPFTKFAVLAAFIYSIFFSFGAALLISWLKQFIKSADKYIALTCTFLIIVFTVPIFDGYLFYDFVKLKIPQEYLQEIDFFKKQDSNTRIANFPQFTYWGWNHYLWGNRGSGFIWYGIPQPILDRAFDGYSRYDENYYWEISKTLYSMDTFMFNNILKKYQINWILVDRNIVTSSYAKVLFTDKLEEMIGKLTNIKLISVFGKIKVYKVDLDTPPKNFVFLADNLPMIGPNYKWGNYDKGYEEYGSYISTQQKTRFTADSLTNMHTSASESDLSPSTLSYNSYSVNSGVDLRGVEPLQSDLTDQIPHRRRPTQNQVYQENKGATNQVFAAEVADSSTPGESSSTTPGVSRGYDVFYPFRSLFTGRQQNELEFGVEDKTGYFSFKAKIPRELVGYKLVIPQLKEKEVAEIDQNDLSKSTVKTPEIYLDGEFIQIPPPSGESSSATPEVSLTLPYIREGNLEVRVPKIKGYYSSEFNPALLNLEPKTCDQFNKGTYKHDFVTDPTSGEDLLRLTSVGSSNCLDFDLPNLSQDIGYLVTLQNRNIEGKSVLFSVINKNSQRADLETYLPKNPKLDKAYFVIPPMEQYGLGYTLHLDNISIGRVKTVNDLGKITVNPIPYRFLTSLKIVKDTTLQGSTLNGDIKVDHPNPSLYKVIFDPSTIGGVMVSQVQPATPEVSLSPSNNTTLVLSQSFDSGWKAYSFNSQHLTFNKLFPFFFGEELKDHVLVNNWENGWRLPQSIINNQQSTIIIVYLPQYLEYIGFILMGAAILVVIFYPNKVHRSSPT